MISDSSGSSLLSMLSSARGERSEQSNRRVAALILDGRADLTEITGALTQVKADLLGDCLEVMTMVAESRPVLVSPYITQCFPFLKHRKTRVRWEAMHAISLVAAFQPDIVLRHLSEIRTHFREDHSTIVRDCAVTAAGNCASSGKEYAEAFLPLLKEALEAYNSKHAKLALEGLAKCSKFLPEQHTELQEIAALYAQHPRPGIRKAGKDLLKHLES